VPTISIPGGASQDPTVYGPATVIAGSGNDGITIIGTGEVIVGNGNDTISLGATSSMLGSATGREIRGDSAGRAIRGDGTRGDSESAGRALRGFGLQAATSDTVGAQAGTVVAGSGNDSITLYGPGTVTIGGGSDTVSFYSSGNLSQSVSGGNDTINVSTGNDTIYELGHATVYGTYSQGTFGSAQINDGSLNVAYSHGTTFDDAVSGSVTLIGSAAPTDFVGGPGSTYATGGSGSDTFQGGSGHDTFVGGSGQNLFEFVAAAQGGQHVITNFVSGQDQLYVEGNSLSYLQSQHDVTTSGGNTLISIDGGKTTIELQGVTGLKGSDIATHK
jgi:Ca2+-binding RTX toxin-like protein